MSKKERERKALFELVKAGHLNLSQCSQRLGLCYRQVLRSWHRFNLEGDAGLLHKSRGRRSNRRFSDEFEQAIVTYDQKYLAGFEPTFAREKLTEAGLPIRAESLRRLLIRKSLWKSRSRKATYRTKRQRRESFGELVQLDGSFHDWFDNGSEYCLMNMVDDSSGITLAQLHNQETTEAAMCLLWAWIEKYGIPKALYTDKKNVYVTDREPTIKEQLANIQPITAFGRCCQELGIEIMIAHSPQAKGRVERSNGTYQNRLIKELKYQGIKTSDEANQLLRSRFCDQLNERFALQIDTDAHRPLGKVDLYQVFVWREKRVVAHDWTIRYHNQFYQLISPRIRQLKPQSSVEVITHIDGKLSLKFKGNEIAFRKIESPPLVKRREEQAKKPLTSAQRAEYGRKGAQHSPWRQYNPDWLKNKKRRPMTYCAQRARR